MSKFTCKLQYTVVYNKKLKPFIEVYYFRLFSSDVFFYIHLHTCMCAPYASMNKFTCSEHSVRKKTRITGKQLKKKQTLALFF